MKKPRYHRDVCLSVIPLGRFQFYRSRSVRSTLFTMSMRHTIGNGSHEYSWVLKSTDLPQFDALVAQAELFCTDDKLHLRNLCNDAARCSGLVTTFRSKFTTKNGNTSMRKMIFDYSRQRVTGETMELLFDLADAVRMTERREALRTGGRINVTEDRYVLHHVLRMPEDYPIPVNMDACRQSGEDALSNSASGASTTDSQSADNNSLPSDGPSLLKKIHQARQQIEEFSNQVRDGTYKTATGKTFNTVLYVGLQAGAYVGPQCVSEALMADRDAQELARGRRICYLSNIDPTDFCEITRDLDPTRTLIVVASHSFADTETMLVARTVKKWLLDAFHGESQESVDDPVFTERHIVAISDNPVRCRQFGVSMDQIFPYLSMCGRYSLCSPVGILPLALHFSYPIASQFLDGAHAMDEHFFDSPLYDNIPVLLGLIGVWNSTFLDYGCRAILPYSQALKFLPSYVQKIDMESNGKRVAVDGTPLLHRSGEIDIGSVGTQAHNVIFQLLHMGRELPADFIGFMESPQAVDLPGEAVSNHDELMSHFFAQPDALAYGKTLVDLIQEGAPEHLREHMLFPGNRPSSTLLLTRLDAFAIGQLIALYEHRTVVQGFLWGINSFDQFGGELGFSLAKKVRSQLSASRKTGASVQGFTASTSMLLEHYLTHKRDENTSTVG